MIFCQTVPKPISSGPIPNPAVTDVDQQMAPKLPRLLNGIVVRRYDLTVFLTTFLFGKLLTIGAVTGFPIARAARCAYPAASR